MNVEALIYKCQLSKAAIHQGFNWIADLESVESKEKSRIVDFSRADDLLGIMKTKAKLLKSQE